MADTLFVDQTTVVATAWLQQVNNSVQRNISPSYVTSTGSANAQVITISGALETALTAGQSFTFKAGYTNTAAMTLQVVVAATTTAASVKSSVGVAVVSGAVCAGATYTVVWNGTYYELQGSVIGSGTVTVANVRNFGATGDGTTNDAVAIQAAIDSLPATLGGTVYFPTPSVAYKLNSGLSWSDKPVTLIGDNSAVQPNSGTKSLFAAGVVGITMQNGSLGLGAMSRIENLHLVGSDSGAGSNDGLVVQCTSWVVRNVTVEGFGGNGLNVLSGLVTATASINANIGYAERVRAYNNKTNGIYVQGVDSNACVFNSCDASNNTGWGIYDIANLSNTYIGPHVSGNASGGYYFKQYARVIGGYKETDGLSGVTITSGGAGYCNLDFIANEDPITDNGGAPSRITMRGAGAVISTNLAVASGASATPALLATATSIDCTVPINNTCASPVNLVGTTGNTYVISAKSPALYATQGGQNYYSNSVSAAGTQWNHFLGQSANASVNNIIIYGNGNIQNANNSYGAISDISLKENIVDATPKLNDLLKVQVKNFSLILDETKEKQIGVIAQELQKVFPSLVTPGLDGKLGVKYSVFVPILIKAVQELYEQTVALSERVTALEKK